MITGAIPTEVGLMTALRYLCVHECAPPRKRPSCAAPRAHCDSPALRALTFSHALSSRAHSVTMSWYTYRQETERQCHYRTDTAGSESLDIDDDALLVQQPTIFVSADGARPNDDAPDAAPLEQRLFGANPD